MRPDWHSYRSESRIEKTKFRFKCIQRDVCWCYGIKRHAQRTWVSWIGCPISNAAAAATAAHARLAIYAVGLGWWKSQLGALIGIQQIHHSHFLSFEKCRGCKQKQQHCTATGHISIVTG